MRILSRPVLTQLAWHALALAILACLPVLKYHLPWWAIAKRELLIPAVLLAAYGASALAVVAFVRTEGWRSAALALAITLSLFGLAQFLLLLAGLVPPRYLLPIFAAAAVLVPLSVVGRNVRFAGVALLGVALLAIGVVNARSMTWQSRGAPKIAETFLTTAFYALRVVGHHGVVPVPATRGGGLDSLGDDVLLTTGDGQLYVLKIGASDQILARKLPTRVPLNREEFAAAFGGSAQAPKRSIEYSEEGPPRVQTWRFRLADAIVQDRGDKVRIFASHHYWNAKDECFLVRVSQVEVDKAQLPIESESDQEQAKSSWQWQTIYESEPCIPMTGKFRKRGKNPFRGEEIGGRMALLDERTLLLTLGDHGFYGMESVQAFSQDPQASYGKTIRIDLKTHAHETNTLGHRNPQGLYVTGDGRVWETEHSAQGGDELNLIVPGSNYGWPLVTYGTAYGAFAWPASREQNRHTGYAQPVYAWVPSVGISNLIRIERDRFGTWKDNLIAGSLATRSLYRIVTDGDRIVVNEPIPVGSRVRDLLELKDGRILLWTDDAALVTIEPVSGMGVAMQFAMSCSGCHELSDGLSHRMGPDLYQVVGRDVAGTTFDEYSPAMKQFGGVWSKERLDAFLRDPQGTVPGTSMGFIGIEDDQQRARLIEYLQDLSDRRGPGNAKVHSGEAVKR